VIPPGTLEYQILWARLSRIQCTLKFTRDIKRLLKEGNENPVFWREYLEICRSYIKMVVENPLDDVR